MLRPRPRRRRLGWGWLFSLLFSTSVGVLLFLCITLLHEPESPVAPPPTPPADWAADFPTRIDRVTAALTQLGWLLPTPTEEPQGAGSLRWVHRRYDVIVPQPREPGAIELALDAVHSAAPGVTINVIPATAGAQIQVGVDGLLTHTLTLHWLGRHPRAAIIIDDLGNDLLIARALAGIEPPLTLAVMPLRPFSQEVAELASLLSREVLVHLPMEADSGQDFGAQGVLRVDFDRNTVLRWLDQNLAGVPHAVGVNNHMGSRFTSDRDHMQWVLERLKEKNLFFVDSRTSAHSVACEVAATLALPCAARSVFLDDTDDESAIRVQLDALLNLARTRGDVIAIGHARAATVAALQTTLPGFTAAGVDVVPVSTILADPSPRR